jgi:hypothetical protein
MKTGCDILFPFSGSGNDTTCMENCVSNKRSNGLTVVVSVGYLCEGINSHAGVDHLRFRRYNLRSFSD